MDIVSRLKKFIDYTALPVSQFADTALIPRPTLSQILSGRNKKISNELISKLHEAFPQLNVLWLMFGDGSMVEEANFEFSEAKKGVEENVQKAQFADTDNINTEAGPQKISRENRPEKLDEAPTIFSCAFHDDFGYNGERPGSGAEPETFRSAPMGSPRAAEADYSQQGKRYANTGAGRTDQRRATGAPLHGQQKMQAQQLPFDRQEYRQPMPREIQQIVNHEPTKRITHITVFYSDNSYQIYLPSDSIPE